MGQETIGLSPIEEPSLQVELAAAPESAPGPLTTQQPEILNEISSIVQAAPDRENLKIKDDSADLEHESTTKAESSTTSQKRTAATLDGKPKKPKTSKKVSAKDQGKSSNSRAISQAPAPNTEKSKSLQKNGKKQSKEDYQVPIRLNIPPYKPEDLVAVPRPPAFLTPNFFSRVLIPNSDQEIELFATDDHPFNRRGFRYIPCEASPKFPLLGYRQIEVPPYIPRVSYEDASSHILVDRETSTIVSTEKGYRTARANIGVREGKWYWECRIIKGNTSADNGNVRVGWTRREG